MMFDLSDQKDKWGTYISVLFAHKAGELRLPLLYV